MPLRKVRRRIGERTVATWGRAESKVLPTMSSGRAYAVWSVGVFAYVTAVFQRTSLGVAGIETAHRYAVEPAVLSSLVVVQVVVYASMQVPAGLLLDRYGTRALVVVGAVVMALGQFTLAASDQFAIAVFGRLLVGLGDSLTLIAVLKLIARWFPDERAATLSQLTGMIGQSGQLLSAMPLAAVLHEEGWTRAYSSAASISVLVAILAAAVIRNAPGKQDSHASRPVPLMAIRVQLHAVIRDPGTRVGFFAHMGTMFPLTTFVLLWGVPYFIEAQHMSVTFVGGALSASAAASIGGGIIIGLISARAPHLRRAMVYYIIGANIMVWTVVLLLPTRSPAWLLLVLVLTMSLGAPGSLIGFDFARTSMPSALLGTAQGVVNTGGYVATLMTCLAVGALLSTRAGYDLASFRTAWLALYPVWALAIYGVWASSRSLTAKIASPRQSLGVS